MIKLIFLPQKHLEERVSHINNTAFILGAIFHPKSLQVMNSRYHFHFHIINRREGAFLRIILMKKSLV